MKIIYRAADIVEAHLVAGMLKAHGIESYVSGHYLQGAVGDLSPMDFANVLVGESDSEEAEVLIHSYETSLHGNVDVADTAATDGRPGGLVVLDC